MVDFGAVQKTKVSHNNEFKMKTITARQTSQV